MRVPIRKRLLMFFIVYSFINYLLVSVLWSGAHGSELAIFLLGGFWIIAGLILYGIYTIIKHESINKLNYILFILCSPIPTLIFVFGYNTLYNIKHEKIYYKAGYKVKETRYPFRKETEYRSNFDTREGEMLMDSVIRYDEDKRSYVTDYYTDWERYLNP